MNSQLLRLKILNEREIQSEARAAANRMIEELQAQCNHPAVTKLDNSASTYDEAIICNHCGMEWKRFPMDTGWMEMRYKRPLTEAKNWEEYSQWRL